MAVTAGGHLVDQPTASNNPGVTLKPTANLSSTTPAPAASMEAAKELTSPWAPGDVSRPLSVALTGTTSTAQVDKVNRHEEGRN